MAATSETGPEFFECDVRGSGPSGDLLRQRIFAVYLGLTVSGYDLADTSNPMTEALVRRVHGVSWGPAVTSYFAQARLDTCAANPYWPRAALMLFACTHIDPETGGYSGWDDLAGHLCHLDNIDACYLGEETLGWIAQLPGALAQVQHHPEYGTLLAAHTGVTRADAHAAEAATDIARSRVGAVFGIRKRDLPRVEVVLNPLQSPFVADFLDYQGALYVVTAAPKPDSIVHELLHRVLGPALSAERDLIASYCHLLEPAFQAMREMQYAWANDAASWLRVFEESMVRATTIWVAYGHDVAYALMLAEAQARAGFLYVPVIVRQISQEWKVTERAPGSQRMPGMRNIRSLLQSCLSACESLATRDHA